MTAGTQPLVSIVTPTFPGRERVLLERCIPSVAQLDWPQIEHVIVSDRNPDLAKEPLLREPFIRFVQINETWRNPTTEASIGAVPWMLGSRLALGEFVAFLGDDDEVLPEHVDAHVEAMIRTESFWSVSRVEFYANEGYWNTIGDDTFELGHLDGSGIMCHKDALRVATWDANGENAADYRLIRDWQAAGLRGTFVDKVTAKHHDGWLAGKTGRPDRILG